MSKYHFTNQWAVPSQPNWEFIFTKHFRPVPLTVVEIGAYEGQTTFHVADNYLMQRPGSEMYVIDPFTGSMEHSHSQKNNLHARFNYNLQLCEADFINVIPKSSEHGLIDLINRGVKADIVYVDGDHTSGAVLRDLTLSWLILKPKGVIMCDDTHWNAFKEVQLNPRLGVDAFIHAHWHEIKLMDIPVPGQCAFFKK